MRSALDGANQVHSASSPDEATMRSALQWGRGRIDGSGGLGVVVGAGVKKLRGRRDNPHRETIRRGGVGHGQESFAGRRTGLVYLFYFSRVLLPS
jgi:hypothetical protein